MTTTIDFRTLDDFRTLGMAVALSDLASAKGMTVRGVCEFPNLLRDAGLPVAPAPTLVNHSKINRDTIDAVLWRCGWRGEPPTLTKEQAEAKVLEAEAMKAAAAIQLTKRETKRREANPTMDDIKGDLIRSEAPDAPPEAEAV